MSPPDAIPPVVVGEPSPWDRSLELNAWIAALGRLSDGHPDMAL